MNLRSTMRLIAAIVVATAVPALAQELPSLRAGLWEQTITPSGAGMPDGTKPVTTRVCLDEAMQRQQQAANAKGAGAGCDPQTTRRTGEAYVVEAQCRQGQLASRSTMTVRGDFRTQYTSETVVTLSGGPEGPAEARRVTQARYLGACPTGWKIGDVEMNGQRRNLLTPPPAGTAPPPPR